MTARELLRLYRAADPAVIDAGRAWYPSAMAQAAELAPLAPAGVGPVRAAGVIAALSPRMRWAANLANARAACVAASRAVGDSLFGAADDIDAAVYAAAPDALPIPRQLAARILRGELPDRVIGGPKSRAFWRAICGDAESVTIDVWAARAVGLDPNRLTPRRIREAQAAYTRAARIVGETPRDFQAIVWLAARGVAPTDPAGFRPTDAIGSRS